MTGELNIGKMAVAMEEESEAYESEFEASIAESKASTAKKKKKKKKKSSTTSTAASTSSTAGKKTKKQELEGVDDVSKHTSVSKKEKKKRVPKKIKRVKIPESDTPETDDVISCLTDNSKSIQGTKQKRKKTKSELTSATLKRSDSASIMSEGTKKTKSSTKKKIKQKADDENSILSETSNSKRKKKSRLAKLNKEDTLYHKKSKNSGQSVASSVTSAYHSRHSRVDDDSDNANDRSRRTRSLSRSTRTKYSNASSTTSSVVKDGHVRRTVKRIETTPKRSQSVDQYDPPRRSRLSDRDGNSSDSDVSLSDSSEEEEMSTRSKSRRQKSKKMTYKRRSKSADIVRPNKKSPPMGKKKNSGRIPNGSNHSYSSHASTSSRRNPGPVRIAARNDSVEVRSISADTMKEMRQSLSRGPSQRSTGSPRETSRKSYAAPTPREAPLRRGVTRNSSAPLRSAMRQPSYNRMSSGRGPGRGQQQGRGPLRSTKSAFLNHQQQQQRRPPPRTNSKDMSMTEHVAMLKGIMNRQPSNRRNAFEENRSRSQPPNRPAGVPGDNRLRRQASRQGLPRRSPSPNRGGILRIASSKGRSHKSNGSASIDSLLSKGDIIHSSEMDIDNRDRDDNDDSLGLNNDQHDEHDEDLNDAKETEGFNRRDISRTRSHRIGLKKSGSEGTWGGLSNHSLRSAKSQMSIDKTDKFEDDPKWKAALRYIYLLPPNRSETSLKKKARVFTWISLMLDFIAAMVAVIQYDGATQCCDEDMFDSLLKIRWDVFFRVFTVLYVCMILAEIVPVIKNGMPFNIINPTFGFLITFGLFFDDSVFEAVAMWVIEALAIFFEFLVYRVNARIYFETSFKLKQIDDELATLKDKRKRIVGEIMNAGSVHNSMHSGSNSGSFHSDSLHGSRHGDPMRGSRHGDPMRGSRHGNSLHGSRHGDPMRGSRHGDPMRGSRHGPDIEVGLRGPLRGQRPPPRPPYDDDDDGDDDDDSSFSGHSFGGDDDFYDEKTPSGRSLTHSPTPRPRQPPVHMPRLPSGLNGARSRDALGGSNHSYGGNTAITGFTGAPGNRFRLPGEVKQNRLFRQRRMLRENKKTEANDLYYHFVATILNISLAVGALIFVVTISSTGGLCFKDGKMKPFSFDQLGLCDRCPQDSDEGCQQCSDEGNQCYYPYY